MYYNKKKYTKYYLQILFHYYWQFTMYLSRDDSSARLHSVQKLCDDNSNKGFTGGYFYGTQMVGYTQRSVSNDENEQASSIGQQQCTTHVYHPDRGVLVHVSWPEQLDSIDSDSG